MKKINLNQKILTIRGEPLKNPELDDRGQLKRDKKGNPIMKDMVLRDYLLTILGTRFPVLNTKEVFWTTELGILIADEKNKEIEISDDKMKFLIRILKNNKIKQILPMGREREIELFFPWELGQILKILGVKEEELEEK